MHSSTRDGRVAVIIPVYRARFLAEALESVFFQSRPADQVIVVDDGSPDQYALQSALAAYGGRVQVICQPNRGAGAARNAGIAAATTEFVAFLDADDRWLPNYLYSQREMLADAPELDVVYTDGMFIGKTPFAGKTLMSEIPSCGEVTLKALLSQQCTVHLSAAVARREAIIRTGMFDATLRRGQDFDLWLRLARDGAHFSYQRKVLMLRRVHDDNLSGDQMTELERALTVYRKTLRTMELDLGERSAAQRRVRELESGLARERGKELLRRGELAAAYSALRHAGQRGWKVWAALVGIRIAPALMRRLYVVRTAASPAS